ncbi:ABC transporter ATP-binding protein [Singulisphaera sp. PoT]|uniref:ABC transporter ATP-binding protein n=1 Tax=Singulisphaera sp. PoT TaxID=3411797 RepID=UPI003BF60849
MHAQEASVDGRPVAGTPPVDPGRRLAVRIRGVVKSFGAGERRVLALRGVDWDVYAGQMSMLVGPSGCGKTTLLSVVAGILDCDEGGVDVFGRDLTAMGDAEKTEFRAASIGFVFQQYNLLPALDAAENVAIPLVIAGSAWPAALARARALLADLGLGHRVESLPSQLSGGEQQRAAIARALIHEPRLIVADEPTAAVDNETGQSVMALLGAAAVRQDRAVIVVTHDSRIFHFADRIARMDDGRITELRERTKDAPALPEDRRGGDGDLA